MNKRFEDMEPWEQLAAKLADSGPTEEHAREWVQEVLKIERERIAQAIAAQEALAARRWRDESHAYWEGARDAYDRAERIASAGGL